jgi:hypothetical protein
MPTGRFTRPVTYAASRPLGGFRAHRMPCRSTTDNDGEVMASYGTKAAEKVETAMLERKQGTLKSGTSGKKVTSRKQAIAIGLSEARKEGAKVPDKAGNSGQTSERKAHSGRPRRGT